MFIYRQFDSFNKARIDLFRREGELNLILKIITVYPYEEKVQSCHESQKSPFVPLFQRGQFSIFYLNQSKRSPPFEKGRGGGISGKAFSNG
jgi:hypothetical protein